MKLLYLAVTNDCNLRCIYCYACKGKDYMKFSTAKKVIEKYGCAKVQFTGGEPLLNYKLVKKLAENYECNFAIQTNATLLDEEKIEEMLDLGISIAVSIDAPSLVNDMLRPYANGEGSTRDVLKAMMLLKSYNVDYGVTCVVTPYNQRYLKEFVDLVYAFGARSISFDIVKQVGKAKNIPLPDIKYVKEAIDYARKYRLRFRNILKESLSLECAAMNGKAVFVTPLGKEYFICPTLAYSKVEKCPRLCYGYVNDRT